MDHSPWSIVKQLSFVVRQVSSCLWTIDYGLWTQ